jgi:hypothetical protein
MPTMPSSAERLSRDAAAAAFVVVDHMPVLLPARDNDGFLQRLNLLLIAA